MAAVTIKVRRHYAAIPFPGQVFTRNVTLAWRI